MKIIKSYSDSEFFKRIYSYDGSLSWGLGENGELYCQCSDFINEEWYSLKEASLIAKFLTIKDMKKIVKEFDHLLVWL